MRTENGGPAARVGPVRRVLGVPINALTMEQALRLVEETIERRGRLLIGVVNAAKLANMRRDEALRRAVLRADVIFADGMSVVWAARLLGKRLPERITGIDLMDGMLRRGSERGYRVYCLGATDDTLQRVAERIHSDYAGVVISGMHHGYFGSHEEEDIAADIRASHSDILLVAMSPPRKEIFMARWSRQLDVPVCHGVGGAFEVMAGAVQRAPLRWQSLGLEWLFRVKQEPRRLWRRYLVTNALFGGMVLTELLTRGRRS